MHIHTDKPHKIFAEVIEREALRQFESAMQQPFVVQGALMPDAHAGYSLPIGAVVATSGVVVPAWVGYDIGCGMCAVPTTFEAGAVCAYAHRIFESIHDLVPVGFKRNDKPIRWSYNGPLSDFTKRLLAEGGALKQLGTLGGGNHFIEIGADAAGVVWIVIHSGSRNVGHKIATHYMKAASPDGRAREGHFGLDENSQLGRDYITDLNFGLAFALQNRLTMVERIEGALRKHIPGAVDYSNLINRNHNHAEKRHIARTNSWYRSMQEVWIHRKGATHAEFGMMGVIPGNMRDGSFIVEGKGNPESLYSSSHGAGRVLGRKQAKAQLSLDEFKGAMSGIVARVDAATLDESPFAYKSIFEVMAQQVDLVDVKRHIIPIINVKG